MTPTASSSSATRGQAVVAYAVREKKLTIIDSVRDSRPILAEVRPELRPDPRIKNYGQMLNVTFAMLLRLELQLVGLTIDVVDFDCRAIRAAHSNASIGGWHALLQLQVRVHPDRWSHLRTRHRDRP